MATFFTSDTHFGHARIIELCDRPFADVDEMDEALIENWNRVVRPGDTVYHLGDVCLGRLAETLPLTDRLHGTRYLVPGNHDRVSSTHEKGRQIERFTPIYEGHGWRILPEQSTMTIADEEVLICHFPYRGDSTDEERHVEARPVDDGRALIHGHIHTERRVEGRMFNVGVELNGYAPVPLEAIEEFVRTTRE